MATVRWGVLGATSHIAGRVLPAVARVPGCVVAAVAARTGRVEAATEVARRFGARVHDGYEALLADPGVDAVYVALPNSGHVPWTLRALGAGKHVLVEKPMAMSEEDCARIGRAAAGLVVMEAYMYRFHPQQARAAALLASGEIGELRVVRAAFAHPTPVEGNIRFDPALGGGATWDVGCYAFDVPLWAFGAEPRRVWARFHGDVVDLGAVAALDFGDGRSAVLDYGLEYGPRAWYEFQGTRGSVSVRNAWTTPHEDGVITVVTLDGAREEVVPAADAYELQVAAFVEAIRTGEEPLVPLAHSARTARVGRALVEANAAGGWVELPRP
ncbi:Gfo/Idh/MocA family protein [Saccharothrix syringae]|uniref:Gfo/Idh/MocA family oxidoreductase n=1 Tax=Saccharothrix syringae TaxID=103733 RepID=A0A5Q0H705_SACSY|nr:Gfo/Idh/MocA family oxidoreductase [Saccharothrix syringae]QFZ21743.1 Gfo/Idh/MocA family oxidoreductase [Saccharothrix syringae]